MKRLKLCFLIFIMSFSTLAADQKDSVVLTLQTGNTGSYLELSIKPNPEELILVYVPGISALLERAEQLKGSELSEKQITAIKSSSNVVALPKELAEKTIKERGYY